MMSVLSTLASIQDWEGIGYDCRRRGKLFKKAFERARRGKDISSFERQEKESGFNFLHNPNNGRMQSGHVKIDGIGLFKQIIKSGT